MLEMYVVVYHGYEGIEAILWAGADADDARERVAAYRAQAARVAVTDPSIFWDDKDDPDRVCVMRHEEGADAYTCCCVLLGVAPSKAVLL